MKQNSNINRLAEIIEANYGREFSSVEQYLFGFYRTYAVICLNVANEPFMVVHFDNVKDVRVCGQFDSRVDAAKDMFFRWSNQFA